MNSFEKEYTDLERALEDVRAALTDWVEKRDASESAEALRHTRLVLQEWLANLSQHAHFPDDVPHVHIQLTTQNRDVHGVVKDNSEGFDLADSLPDQTEKVDGFPERGMGLRMMDACTASLSYSPEKDGHHCLEFSIPADHDPWLSTPF